MLALAFRGAQAAGLFADGWLGRSLSAEREPRGRTGCSVLEIHARFAPRKLPAVPTGNEQASGLYSPE